MARDQQLDCGGERHFDRDSEQLHDSQALDYAVFDSPLCALRVSAGDSLDVIDAAGRKPSAGQLTGRYPRSASPALGEASFMPKANTRLIAVGFGISVRLTSSAIAWSALAM